MGGTGGHGDGDSLHEAGLRGQLGASHGLGAPQGEGRGERGGLGAPLDLGDLRNSWTGAMGEKLDGATP